MIETVQLDALRVQEDPCERLDRGAQVRRALAPAEQEELGSDATEALEHPL